MKSSNPLRTFGIWLALRLRPVVLPLAIVLLAVNLSYSLFFVGKRVNPGRYHITRTLNEIGNETLPAIKGWLNSTDDTLYMQRLWYGGLSESWKEKGVSLLLFRDSVMVYWSNYPFVSNASDFWLTHTGTVRQIGTHQILTQTYRKGDHVATIVINLRNRDTDRYNPAVFPNQHITLLPIGDSIRARLVKAEPISAVGNRFYIEAKPMQSMPWWAEICGWAAILLACLYVKNFIRRCTGRFNAFLNAAILALIFAVLRIGLFYAGIPNANGVLFNKIYGLHNLVLGSLGDLLLSYGMVFIFVAYLYQIKAKLNWQYVRLSKKAQYLVFFCLSALTAGIISVFHYALILSIYTPKINMQIYDIFDLSYTSIMFYLLAVIFVSTRVLLNQVFLTLLATRKMVPRLILCSFLILLILYPVETQIRETGYILVLFYLAYAGADYLRIRYSHYGSFLISLIIFSGYIAFFATQENTIAQNNAQKLYARILATTMQDHYVRHIDEPTNGELSNDIRFRKFTYARIVDNQITFKHNNNNDYQGMASEVKPLRDTTLYRNGQAHFIYHYFSPDEQHGILVISRRETSLLDAVSLYAYIFLILFILCGLLLESAGYTFNIQRLGTRMTFRIRTVVIGVVFFAMSAVTMVIINHTLSNFRNEKRQFVNNNVQRLGISLSQYLLHNPVDTASIQNWIAGEQNEAEYNINIYNLYGDLIATSAQNANFTPRMNSEAYRYLHYIERPFYVSDIGQSLYASAYAPILRGRQTVGYLNLLYYSPSATNSFVQHELLADILNLFLIILFIAVILSEILYRLLTKPFNQLHEAMSNISKMQKIDAVGSSRKISDEIGLLVEQYNLMIDYLEESYRQLAQSEREGAWREMARQVAHEIKNPLTPMRLKIQILQRAMQQEECTELRPKVEATLALLLDQIDLLNNIASEFSDFARLGVGNPARVDLMPLLCNVAKLYDGYENISIRIHFDCNCGTRQELLPGTTLPVKVSTAPIWVNADPDHLSRVFVNICLNAVQAMGGQPDARIDIDIRILCERVWVSFRDNGPGIPEEVQKRIFQPNFTTKSSGSGLGLALSRKIVELVGGHISFESSPGEGTTFTVDLPIDPGPETHS